MFESNGGSEVATQTINAGDKAVKPDDPTRSGYTFIGWYTDSALTTPYYFDALITSDLTLYAGWNWIWIPPPPQPTQNPQPSQPTST